MKVDPVVCEHGVRWEDPCEKCHDLVDQEATLRARGDKYGDYTMMAARAQRIKELFETSPNWHAMPDWHRETLDMIATKLSRILCGDFNHADTWHDIGGYAKLSEDRCRNPPK